MQTKTKSGRILELPSPEEDAQITAAALTDPDNLPLTDEELRQFRKVHGRPQGSGIKEQVTLRLDTVMKTVNKNPFGIDLFNISFEKAAHVKEVMRMAESDFKSQESIFKAVVKSKSASNDQ